MAYSYNLGEMMHSYIQKNGYSIYEISKKAEVNRTTLQKVLTNERKLTKPMLDKLRPYLKLTPSEYSDLVLMIGETKKGKAEIENFNFIKHMIESVYESSYANEAMNRYKLSVAHDVKDYKKELFVGRIAIEGLIHELLHLEYKKELPSIKVYIPNNSNLINGVLQQQAIMFPEFNTLHVNQIIAMSRDKSKPNTARTNLNILSNVLPNIVISKCKYDINYYYGQDIEDKGEFGFPYYIVFSGAVLMLSANCNTALLSSKDTVVEYFTNMFDAFLKKSLPLMTPCVYAEDILPHMMQLDLKCEHLYSLENQPCFVTYLTRDVIEKYTNHDLPNYNDAITLVTMRAEQLRGLKGHTCYFSKTGLNDFVKTGILADFSPEYASPLEVNDRKWLLQELYKEIESNRQGHRMINPYAFAMPSNLICALHKNLGIDFYGFGLNEQNYKYIHIAEMSLVDVFERFFEYISESDLVYSQMDTLNYIDECIKKLS